MSDSDTEKTPDSPPEPDNTPKGGKFSKNITAWITTLAVIGLLIALFVVPPQEKTTPELSQLDFWQRVDAGKVAKCELVREETGITYLRGTFTDGKEKFKVNVLPTDKLEEKLKEKNVALTLVNETNLLRNILAGSVPLIIGLVVLFIIFRMFKNQSMGTMNFGKSRARMVKDDKKKITFKNVAGVKEAQEEVEEIIEFLKASEKFQKLGGKIPKGVLLMGPPGTGKTLLAKAIAGEAGVPFFSISGSDFIEMFVGVGASRVRDMFEQGKKNAPCIIFIDEIDAVGRSRFSGIGGGHDEREQTLNAMLVEMDGFETNEGVIIIAATNRADVLDPALTRPGRFDRQIVIDLPTLEGRREILNLHAHKIKLAPSADLSRIARGTPGFSGADLANLLNEGALLAARLNHEAVEHIDLEEARDKVLWGRERRSRAMEDKERRITAWHEAGHALMQILCENTEPLHKITIIPRGMSLGATMTLPERDVLNRNRSELLDQLVVLCGGRIAEKLFTGDISTGARMDIHMASQIARKMVCDYGMSDKLGFQSLGGSQEPLFLAREMTKSQDHSEETSRMIDAEVAGLISAAYARCEALIAANRDKLELLVTTLLEKETMDGRDVEELLTLGRIRTEEERLAERRQNEPVPVETAEAETSPAETGSPVPEPEIETA